MSKTSALFLLYHAIKEQNPDLTVEDFMQEYNSSYEAIDELVWNDYLVTERSIDS